MVVWSMWSRHREWFNGSFDSDSDGIDDQIDGLVPCIDLEVSEKKVKRRTESYISSGYQEACRRNHVLKKAHIIPPSAQSSDVRLARFIP